MSSHIYHDSPKKIDSLELCKPANLSQRPHITLIFPNKLLPISGRNFRKRAQHMHILDLDVPQKSVLARNEQLSVRREPIAESLSMKLENSSHPTFLPAQSGPFCMRLGCIGGKPVRSYTFARTKRSLGNVGQRIIGVGQQRTGCG